jgi:vancomycin resistance protein VanW
MKAGLLLMGILGAGGLFWLNTPSAPQEKVLSGYATPLTGRTHSQKHNAIKAADALNGKVILPGAEFSFNRVLKSWSWDAGYLKAPVSYDGELIRAYGGGVCQTSTTLYNAALLAGLEIKERHSHVFAPHYVPPGRDAAVAQYTIDLRLRNPYSFPIRIAADTRGSQLQVKLIGAGNEARARVQIQTDTLAQTDPERLTRISYRSGGSGRISVRNPGAKGYRVVTYRVLTDTNGKTRREKLSDDSYQAMDRIIQREE